MAANVIDRLVGVFSPNAGLRRLRARELLQRAYEGASQKDGWRPRRAGASANTDHRADAGILRTRARALVQNSPYIAKGISSKVSNIIGTGIVPRSLSAQAEAIDKLHSDWAKVCDADGRLDLYGIQAAAHRAMEIDGEVLIRLRPRRIEDGLPVPLQLQLLEIDWLDTDKTATNGTNTIINGLEYDPLGRIVAYWLFDQHPGELVTTRGGSRRSSRPIEASKIIHLFNPDRPGQGRGITSLAPVIARVRDLQLYEDAELQRKNLETRLSVLYSGDVSAMTMTESQDQATVRATGELGSLASGSITQVPTGGSLTVVEPKVAPGYVEYVKYQHHIIAAGLNITFEMLTGDVSEVNFSSARVNTLEFRRYAEQLQWLTIIPKLCAPIWQAFIDAAVLAGKLRTADAAVDWATPKWDYVNPEQDVKADLAEISGGLCTISEKLRRRGYKPELVFAELKSDFDRLRADGTLDLLLQLQTHQAPQQPQKTAATSGVRQSHEVTAQMPEQSRTNTSHITVQMPEQPAPVVHVRNEFTLPEQPSPVVNVRNEITTPDPVVNLTASIPPAQVSVTANIPPRTSSTTIERNHRGEIISSSTTERDA